MSNIESKNLLVAVKAFARGNALPLDSSEVHESFSEANLYAGSATSYFGQTIKALVNGKYVTYTIQPTESGYELEELATASSIKQYVQMPSSLPETGEQGIVYIVENKGYIWNGTEWKLVFQDVSTDVESIKTRVSTLETDISGKASINNPIFTGTVTVNNEEVAVKSYVEGLIANIQTGAPGVVSSESPLPTTDYKAGQSWRVAEDGIYGNANCEVGDLIICVANYNEETASNADFMAVQSNIDGAVTSTANTSTVGEIVVYDAVTGKVVKGSGLTIDSLNEALAKIHEHANKSILDTYTSTQEDLLESAKTEAQGLVDNAKELIDKELEDKVSKTELEATETEINAKITTIEENLNSKITGTEVDEKISGAISTVKTEIETDYNTAISDRIGGIDENTTVKAYIDTAVGSGGTASAEAIATAKTEAIDTSNAYTNSAIEAALTIVEF